MNAEPSSEQGKPSKLLKYLNPKTYNLSSGFQAGCATALMLSLIVLAVWLARWIGKESVSFQHAMTLPRFIWEVGLALVGIPALVYLSFRYWGRIAESPHADIDIAWKAGLDALASIGASIQTRPVYLVLGSTRELERSLMQASRVNFQVNGVPSQTETNYALRWYVSQYCIYLFCSHRTSELSTFAHTWSFAISQLWDKTRTNKATESAAAPRRRRQEGLASSGVDKGSESIENKSKSPSGEQTYSDSSYGHDIARRATETTHNHTVSGAPPTDHVDSSDAGETETKGESAATSPPTPTLTFSNVRHELPAMPAVKMSEEQERLEYVCRLLRRARGRQFAANGILTLLPFEIGVAQKRDLQKLGEAAKVDIEIARSTLGVTCPVTVLVTGLEREPGFFELADRLDENDRDGRLGADFSLRARPTRKQLSVLSRNFVYQIEDLIYGEFRGNREWVANKSGNQKLYALLSLLRHRLRPNLRIVLGSAFCCDDVAVDEAHEAVFLSGCYVAATGTSTDRHAFVGGILGKLHDERKQVAWNRRTQERQAKYRVLMWIGRAILAGLVIGLILQARG